MRFRRGTAVGSILISALLLTGGTSFASPVETETDQKRNAQVEQQDERVSGPGLEFARTTGVQAVADALAALGRTDYRDVFSGIRIDEASGRVILHGTKTKRADSLVANGLARVSAEEKSAVTVQVVDSRYTRVELEQAAAQVWAAAKREAGNGVEVYSIVLPSDGHGLEVRMNAPQRAGALSAAVAEEGTLAAADVDYVAGHRVRPLTRENPAPPYQGGIPIRWDFWISGWDCTAAFGVRNSAGTEYLLTAEHCYDVGDGIEDMNGDSVGTVRSETVRYDAALIQTDSQSGVWVNDDFVFNVRSQQFSFEGEYVCQSGYTSYPNRCQIQVTNDLIQYELDDGKGVRVGVEGRQCGGCPAAAHGDSGGPVWSIRSSDGFVAARGIVSAGHTPVQEDVSYEYVIWSEIPFAAPELGVSLQTS